MSRIETLTALEGKLGQVSERASQVVKDVEASEKAVRESLDRTEQQVVTAGDRFRERLGRMKDDSLKVFDDLEKALTSSEFDSQLKPLLDLVKSGTLSMNELLKTYGNAVIDIGKGNQRLREILHAVDPKVFERQTQETQRVMRRGLDDLGSIMAELGRHQDAFSKRLAEIAKQSREAGADLDSLARQARQIAALAEDGQGAVLGDSLADALERAARNGGL